MLLSPNVKRGPHPPTDPKAAAARKNRNSPFGGMNVTTPPYSQPRHRVSAAEQKRLARHGGKRGEGETKGKGKEREKDPMKALKMQRALASVSYEQRGRTKEAIGERGARFEDLGLLDVVREAVGSQVLAGMEDVRPTPIQRLAIPALLGREDGRGRGIDGMKKETQHFLLAAETGSGKTLAYVLPVLDALKRAEHAEAETTAREAAAEEQKRREEKRTQLFSLAPPETTSPLPSTARPRVLILLPTSELVTQTGTLLKNLSHIIKFRTALLSASYTATVLRNRLFTPQGIDIVVSTPHLLSSITESDPNILSRVSHLVIDEADSLLDRSFAPITGMIIDRTSPSLRQLVLCSATIPRSLDAFLHKRFPDIRRLVTPNLHAIPRRVQLSVVDIEKVPFQNNRDLACAQVVWDIGKESAGDENEGGGRGEKKIVVFVNEREKAAELAGYLRGKGIDAKALSRDSDERSNADVLASFTQPQQKQQKQDSPPPPSSTTHPPHPKPKPSTRLTPYTPANPSLNNKPPLLNTKVLVTTDIASRGIDTLPVKHVILYDVPHTTIDFIHRLGRVGRMGRRGRGVVLVGRGDRRDVVREVREGMFGGRALI